MTHPRPDSPSFKDKTHNQPHKQSARADDAVSNRNLSRTDRDRERKRIRVGARASIACETCRSAILQNALWHRCSALSLHWLTSRVCAGGARCAAPATGQHARFALLYSDSIMSFWLSSANSVISASLNVDTMDIQPRLEGNRDIIFVSFCYAAHIYIRTAQLPTAPPQRSIEDLSSSQSPEPE
jgi:hypothetical protein